MNLGTECILRQDISVIISFFFEVSVRFTLEASYILYSPSILWLRCWFSARQKNFVVEAMKERKQADSIAWHLRRKRLTSNASWPFGAKVMTCHHGMLINSHIRNYSSDAKIHNQHLVFNIAQGKRSPRRCNNPQKVEWKRCNNCIWAHRSL